jgi:nitric oxide reductase large subunit
MDVLLIVLRLLHIVAAFIWIALGLTSTIFILPAAVSADENGMRYLKTLFVNTPFTRIIPAVAGLTTLAGLLMYFFANSASHFSSTGNAVLGIGAVAGLLATIHGGAVTGRATRTTNETLVQYVGDGSQPISADGMAKLRAQIASLISHSRVSLALMIVALVGMASARYL